MSSPLAPPRGQPPEAVRLPRSPRMKDLPAELRPRERLLAEGPAALGVAELVAVLLRTGSQRRSALEVATELLCRHGSLERLAAASPAELRRTSGMGQVKALNLLAAFELGRRLRALPPNVRPTIRAPADVAALIMGDLRFRRGEWSVGSGPYAGQLVRRRDFGSSGPEQALEDVCRSVLCSCARLPAPSRPNRRATPPRAVRTSR